MFFVPHRVLFQSPGRRGKSAIGLAASGRGQDPQQSSHFSQLEVECSSSRLQICVLNVWSSRWIISGTHMAKLSNQFELLKTCIASWLKKSVSDSWWFVTEIRLQFLFFFLPEFWRPHARPAIWEGTHHWEDGLLVCRTLQHNQAQTEQINGKPWKSKVHHDETIYKTCHQIWEFFLTQDRVRFCRSEKTTPCIVAVRAFLAATVPWVIIELWSVLSDFLPFESAWFRHKSVNFMRHTLERWWPQIPAQSQKPQFI